MESSRVTMKSGMELRHVRWEVRTALELAVVTLAPTEIVDRLGLVAGLLEALDGLPPDSPPCVALVPRLSEIATRALAEWSMWRAEHLDARLPRG